MEGRERGGGREEEGRRNKGGGRRERRESGGEGEEGKEQRIPCIDAQDHHSCMEHCCAPLFGYPLCLCITHLI